jgi:hypothetical protein
MFKDFNSKKTDFNLAKTQGVDMSISKNENQQANDAISINENGEVVIKDPKLAEAIQELNPEELDAISGGHNGNCKGAQCGGHLELEQSE